MNLTPSDALTIAEQYHGEQRDWYGVKYVEHPKNVAANFVNRPEYEMLTSAEQQRGLCAAYLHDTVEDTNMTLELLADLGAEPELVALIDALTHRENEPLSDYYDRIVAEGRLACLLKLSDIQHNSDPVRIESLDETTKSELLNKYRFALQYITERM